MSTQNSGFPPIPFSISQPFTTIRLLELPDELLDVVTNQSNQPKNISLVSTPASDAVADNLIKEGFVYICTDDRVWTVKQVSTSNSLYVCQTQKRSQDASGLDNNVQTDINGITAMAKPTSMLELYQVAPSTYNDTIKKEIHRLVPEFDIEQRSQLAALDKAVGMTCSELCSHIPGPRQAVNLALAKAGTFEIVTDDTSNRTRVQVYQPSLELLLQTWRLINEAVTTSNGKVNISSAEDMFAVLENYRANSGSDRVQSHHLAVARRMLVSSSDTSESGQLSMFHALGLTQEAQVNVLNNMEVTRWIGNLYLNVVRRRGTDSLNVSAFIKEWDDLVPAQWVKYCSIEVLDNACELYSATEDDQQTVQWKSFVLSSAESVTSDKPSDTSTAAMSNTASSKNKRKWHEKFAAQRVVKK